MKKLLILLSVLLITSTLTACTQQSVVCGEGTVIRDGKCVAADAPIPNDDEDPALSCDILQGDVFYEANFEALRFSFVDNELGNPHTPTNFVIWGQSETGPLVNDVSVDDGVLSIVGLQGDQLDPYHDSGLGYQFFEFETDVTYSVCAIIEGPSGQYATAELGIYYGYGSKDDFELKGEPQMIIQDFKPTLTTNTDYGQFVIFLGNVTGEVKIHYIKIVEND